MAQRSKGQGGMEGGLEKELRSLEEQARTATAGYETQFLNRAGNLCAEAGEKNRALQYYGRAIDAYLESGRFSAAEVLCSKVLRIVPDAVRARCTLAWLSIGRGYRSETDQEILDYVHAAQRAGQEALAAKQLRMMAESAFAPELRELLGEQLLELGEFEGSDQVLGRVYEERNGLRPAPVPDEGRLWGKLLRAALMSPAELQEHAGSESDDNALPSLGS